MDAGPKNDPGLDDDDLADDSGRPMFPRAHSRDSPQHPKDANGRVKKIIFW